MGLWNRWFGGATRAGRNRARDVASEVRRELAGRDPHRALALCRAALLEQIDDSDLLRVTSAALLARGDRASSELFARAADAPDELSRMVELGSHLLSRDDPQLAAAFLGRALAFAPFDATIRSELAIAQARSGWPQSAVETLALHPCLGDDPGALFEFAWASLLCGDREAAEGALGELSALPRAGSLLRKLEHALERSRIPHAGDPPDARDYLFLEHGAVLLDAGGTRGRHAELALDPARIERLLGRGAYVAKELIPRPRRVAAADGSAVALARVLSQAVDAELVDLEPGVPGGTIVVARRGVDLEAHRDAAASLITFALVLDWSSALSRAPDLVGALARDVSWPEPLDGLRADVSEDPALASFLRDRRPHLPPSARRLPSAYVPDAPLPWP